MSRRSSARAKRWPMTAAAWNACRSRGASRSMRASTRLWMEAGTASSRPSSALRSSCSRNSGLPSARSMQASATRCVASMKLPARLSASSCRSGPRSMVANGVPRQLARHASVERVALDARGHDQQPRTVGDGGRQRREMREDLRIGPMQVLDDQQGRAAPAGICGERRDERALAAVARGVVHRVVERAPFAGLRQVEQVVEKDAPLRRRPRRRRQDAPPRAAAPPDRRPATGRAGCCSSARIGSWPLPTPKSSTSPRWIAKPCASAKRRISSTSRVLPMPASPRTIDDLAGTPAEAGASDAPELLELGLAADERAAAARESASPEMPRRRQTRTGASMPLKRISPSASHMPRPRERAMDARRRSASVPGRRQRRAAPRDSPNRRAPCSRARRRGQCAPATTSPLAMPICASSGGAPSRSSARAPRGCRARRGRRAAGRRHAPAARRRAPSRRRRCACRRCRRSRRRCRRPAP